MSVATPVIGALRCRSRTTTCTVKLRSTSHKTVKPSVWVSPGDSAQWSRCDCSSLIAILVCSRHNLGEGWW